MGQKRRRTMREPEVLERAMWPRSQTSRAHQRVVHPVEIVIAHGLDERKRALRRLFELVPHRRQSTATLTSFCANSGPASAPGYGDPRPAFAPTRDQVSSYPSGKGPVTSI